MSLVDNSNLPKMLIIAWFKTWNSANKSSTKSRNTVIVISFSGSSRTYRNVRIRISVAPILGENRITYITLQQSSKLMLNRLGFPEQSLVNRKLLKSRFFSSDPIYSRISICAYAFCEVAGIVSYVSPLNLRYHIHQKYFLDVIGAHRPRLFVNSPSVKEPIASWLRCFARYANVASGDPSLIIKWIVIKLLSTTVHVESRNRNCNARKTSPTPASPACVATRICSIYLVFGGAACSATLSGVRLA